MIEYRKTTTSASIPHPLSRLGDPTHMQIGDRFSSGGRPLTCESDYNMSRNYRKNSSRLSSSCSFQQKPIDLESIPEGVKVYEGASNKTKLPLFGNKQRLESRLSDTRQVDELEDKLREKGRHGFNEIKKRFIGNDPEGKGNVSRSAVKRIIKDMLRQEINDQCLENLMTKLKLTPDRKLINYAEFSSKFRNADSPDQPRYLDPIQRHYHDTASKLESCMDDDDDDERNNGNIVKNNSSGWTKLKKNEEKRQRSLEIENFLKGKFRTAFNKLKSDFESYDMDNIDLISDQNFINVLNKNGLHLKFEHLDEFLARCGIKCKTIPCGNKNNKKKSNVLRTGIEYKTFLMRFQDRSNDGMTHKIVTDGNHRFNNRTGDADSIGSVEGRIVGMFQDEFLSLLGIFHQIDKQERGYVTQEEFRAALESKFDIEIKEFNKFIRKVPMDEDGNVLYAEFMAQFDTNGLNKPAASLFEERKKPTTTYKPIGPLPHDPTPEPTPLKSKKKVLKPIGALPRDPSPEITNDEDSASTTCKSDHDSFDEENLNDQTCRSEQQIFTAIKSLVKKRFADLETAFHQLDEQNTKYLNQHQLYTLLKRLKFKINPTEIGLIWPKFITNSKGALHFIEFARCFGYSQQSASYPNARSNPPKKGDSDLMMRSRKLNCAGDMVLDGLRNKIDFLADDIYGEFVGMDANKTGFVGSLQFRNVLTELAIELTDAEIQTLIDKFSLDGERIDYGELLKPFLVKKCDLGLLKLPKLPIIKLKGLDNLALKLRKPSNWKTLKRGCQKLDSKKSGFVSVSDFKSTLKLINVELDDEDFYKILSQFDNDFSGKIPYMKFMKSNLNESDMNNSSLSFSSVF